jgi:maltose alpha-D-glucosyltransferase/alpha-amylase
VQLRRLIGTLSSDMRVAAEQLLEREEELIQHVRRVYAERITAWRIRVHGDYNLREVLYDGRDFTIIDFEGEASRPLSDRRRKYTPLRDVAGMLRSFHYAARLALHDGTVRLEDRPALEPKARFWQVWSSAAFLRSYLEAAAAGEFLPACAAERDTLLDFYLVKRAVAELRAELYRVSRLDGKGGDSRVAVPVEGLLQLLDAHG